MVATVLEVSTMDSEKRAETVNLFSGSQVHAVPCLAVAVAVVVPAQVELVAVAGQAEVAMPHRTVLWLLPVLMAAAAVAAADTRTPVITTVLVAVTELSQFDTTTPGERVRLQREQ